MNGAFRDRIKEVGLSLFNMALRQKKKRKRKKVRALPIHERARPSLEIKGGMTFNSKKAHRGGEAVRLVLGRASTGPLRLSPRRSFF